MAKTIGNIGANVIQPIIAKTIDVVPSVFMQTAKTITELKNEMRSKYRALKPFHCTIAAAKREIAKTAVPTLSRSRSLNFDLTIEEACSLLASFHENIGLPSASTKGLSTHVGNTARLKLWKPSTKVSCAPI